MAEAHKSVQAESLKKIFLERERLLSISAPKVDIEEIESKLRGEIEQQNRQLQDIVNSLVTGNVDLKNRIQLAEQKLVELDRLLRGVSEK